ncbi:phage capsid protein [Betaproteobacteria bacterium]|nr:phage capsid protein [Betaproteobacteria bacterium]
MPKKSRPFVVATEGNTIDGRHISRDWLMQMAANYQPEIYTAVVNLEHILSLSPDSTFSSYGKVISLATREAEIFGQKRLQLTAVVEASEDAVTMQMAGKKCFASMEVVPNFTGMGAAYLTGLALTDKPASLGTEKMRFSAFTGDEKNQVYASNAETELQFDAADEGKPDTPAADKGESMFARVKELLGLAGKTHDTRFADQAQAIETLAQSQKELLAAAKVAGENMAALLAALKLTATGFDAMKEDVAALKLALSKIDPAPPRPSAPGGAGAVKTDC